MAQEKKRVLYPGTFDPVTNGHINIMRRALKIFDEVVVAVAYHSSVDKTPLFTVEERLGFLKKISEEFKGRLIVDSFQGLLVDYARSIGATAVVRGLRVVSDFEYEFQMALTNHKLAPDIEMLFFMPNESFAYVSSRSIKEVAALKGDVSAFVPAYVREAITKKYNR